MGYLCKICLLSLIISAVSCNLDAPASSRESFGVAVESADKIAMISDDNELIIPNENISSTVNIGERMWMSYIIESTGEQNAFTVTPYRVTSISAPELKHSISTFHDDGLDLWEVWIAQGFLTFDFRIRAKNQNEIKNHEFSLILQNKQSDTLNLRLVHDAKGDLKDGLSCRTALALKLSEITEISVFDEKTKTTILAIEYKDFIDGMLKTVYRNLSNNLN